MNSEIYLKIINFIKYNYQLLIIAILSLLLVFKILKDKFKLFIAVRKMSNGRKLEQLALKYIKRISPDEIYQQTNEKFYIRVNGEKKYFRLKADFIIIKNNKKILIEVKSGDIVTNPTYSNSRRQMLEYFYYFKVDEIWLFDCNTRDFHKIEFPKKLDIQ